MKNLLIAFSVLAFPMTTLAQRKLPDSIVMQLTQAIEGFKERYHSPSVVLVIVNDQEVIFKGASGYTDLEKKIPATAQSKFPILSVTKPFTATMMMQLSERKLIDVDDDVRKYVPQFQSEIASNLRQTTSLLQLATHTSGLPRNTPADINFTKQVDRWILARKHYDSIGLSSAEDFINSLKSIPVQYPKFEFLRYGDRHYSNLGYSLLGMALEKAAKRSYVSYIVENICQPLGMTNSNFIGQKATVDSIAKGYFYDDSAKEFITVPQFIPNSGVHAGGMYSTAIDLAKFISFQFEYRPDSKKILSVENKTMMHTFSIGWKPAFPLLTHEGAMLGYRCEIAFNPEFKLGWVILTNTTFFEFGRFNEYIINTLSPVFKKRAITALDKFAGTYRLSGAYDSLTIYLKDGNLYSTYLRNELPETRLFPTGENKYRSLTRGNYSIGYEFIQTDTGDIVLLNLGQLMWIKEK